MKLFGITDVYGKTVVSWLVVCLAVTPVGAATLSRKAQVEEWAARLTVADIGPLIHALGDADASVRGAAAEGLERFHGEVGFGVIVHQMTKHANPEWKAIGRKVFGEIGSLEVIRSLIVAMELKDPPGLVSQRISIRKVMRLIYDLANLDPANKTIALRKLDEPDPALVPRLKALRDPNPAVRRAIIVPLGWWNDPYAIPELSRAVGDREPSVRRLAVLALGLYWQQEVVEPLTKALTDSDATVRRAAAVALGHFQDGSAVPPLAKALRDPDPAVQRAALDALGDIEDPSALEALVKASGHQDETLRYLAMVAIGRRTTPEAYTILINALEHPDPSTQMAAVSGIQRSFSVNGAIEDPDRLPDWSMMVKVLKYRGSTDIRHWALRVLRRQANPRAIPALLEAAREDDAALRISVALALGATQDVQAWPGLEWLSRDQNASVREAVITVMGSFSHEGAPAKLRAALKDPDAAVRVAAQKGLAERGISAEMEVFGEREKP